jgi:hypothetical protein
MVYIYLRMYPPEAKGVFASEVGSVPEYADPAPLSRTMYTLLSDVLKKNVESYRFVAPDVEVFDALTVSSYMSYVVAFAQSLRGITY